MTEALNLKMRFQVFFFDLQQNHPCDMILSEQNNGPLIYFKLSQPQAHIILTPSS